MRLSERRIGVKGLLSATVIPLLLNPSKVTADAEAVVAGADVGNNTPPLVGQQIFDEEHGIAGLVCDKFKCLYCNKDCCSSKGLKSHVEEFHEKAQQIKKLYSTCFYCHYWSIWQGNTRKHILSIHPDKEAYGCNSCKERFFSKDDLRNHKIAVHKAKKRHKCPHLDCPFSTNNPYNLKSHLATHQRKRQARFSEVVSQQCSQSQDQSERTAVAVSTMTSSQEQPPQHAFNRLASSSSNSTDNRVFLPIPDSQIFSFQPHCPRDVWRQSSSDGLAVKCVQDSPPTRDHQDLRLSNKKRRISGQAVEIASISGSPVEMAGAQLLETMLAPWPTTTLQAPTTISGEESLLDSGWMKLARESVIDDLP